MLADLVPGAIVRDAALILGGAGLTGLAAQVSVHTSLTPVPFTLQTLAVLITGAALGTVRGALSMLLYLAAGVAGVPWFERHTHGWDSPNFGYIIGFVVAAAVVGELARRGNDRQVVSTIGSDGPGQRARLPLRRDLAGPRPAHVGEHGDLARGHAVPDRRRDQGRGRRPDPAGHLAACRR